jgi:hypothetical protein
MKKNISMLLMYFYFAILKIGAQNIDTLKIVYKVKADLLGYSRDCPSPQWYDTYFREASLPIQFLRLKGLLNVSVLCLDCQQTRNANGIRTCDYFNLYGKLLFYYDHLTKDLYCINAFTDASQGYLRQLFVDRNMLAPSVLSEIVENKTSFLNSFEIEGVKMEDLFLFLKDGKKSTYHSFGVIQW